MLYEVITCWAELDADAAARGSGFMTDPVHNGGQRQPVRAEGGFFQVLHGQVSDFSGRAAKIGGVDKDQGSGTQFHGPVESYNFV